MKIDFANLAECSSQKWYSHRYKYKNYRNFYIYEKDKLDKKIETFKKLFPEYKHLKLYAGVAGFKVVKDVCKKAYEKGYFVLQRNGDVIETFVDELKAA